MEHSKLWYFESFNLFKGYSESELMEVAEMASMKSIAKGDFIFFPEELSKSVYILKKGRIKIGSYSPEGKEIIKVILQPGEIFGELALAGETTRTDFAQALEDDTKFCAFSVTHIEDMMKTNPHLSLEITKIIGWRLKRIENRLEGLVFKDARTRIIDFLRDMGERFGKPVGTETLIMNNLTHKEMASLTATSRQTVTTVLNELREQNKIYFDRKRILIRDMNALT